jgi:hypothetical protein
VSASLIVTDCPECRGTRTAILGTIGLCFACFTEFFEDEEQSSVMAGIGFPHSCLALVPPLARPSAMAEFLRTVLYARAAHDQMLAQ